LGGDDIKGRAARILSKSIQLGHPKKQARRALLTEKAMTQARRKKGKARTALEIAVQKSSEIKRGTRGKERWGNGRMPSTTMGPKKQRVVVDSIEESGLGILQKLRGEKERGGRGLSLESQIDGRRVEKRGVTHQTCWRHRFPASINR